MPLSVLSALSRLGLDPREEAARLSHLAGGVAADQLALTIARLPGRRWTSLEMRNIADRLVALLPGATDSATMDPVTGSEGRKTRSWAPGLLACLVLAAAVLAAAVLVGLVALGSL